MAILTNLFGESPFRALEAHGDRINDCLRLLRDAFRHGSDSNHHELKAAAEKVLALKSEADKLRNNLHEFLASQVLIPIRKEDFFNILEQQDSLADHAVDFAATLSYRELRLPDELTDDASAYLEAVLKNCELASGVISKIDLLVESAFRGRDALTVSRLITELAERDDNLKSHQINLTRKLVSVAEQIPPVDFTLWLRVISILTDLSKSARRIGQEMRKTLKIDSNT